MRDAADSLDLGTVGVGGDANAPQLPAPPNPAVTIAVQFDPKFGP